MCNNMNINVIIGTFSFFFFHLTSHDLSDYFGDPLEGPDTPETSGMSTT